MDYHLFGKLSRWILVVGILLLLHLAWLRLTAGGVRRWEYLGPLSFQPSDLVRLALVLHMAHWLARRGDKIRDFRRGLLPHLVLIGFVLGLIVLQPDLGTALLIGMILLGLLFVGRVRLLHVWLVGMGALPFLYLLVYRVEYRWDRLKAYLDPSADPMGIGYHINQSLTSLGTGGILGVGLGAGRQKHLHLPEPHTDFVFSVIGEELGFMGASFILILFLVFAWRGLRIARRAADVEGFFLATGLTLMITLYAFFNIAVAIGLVPTTGLPLPFISYGGSSLLLSLIGTGILLNISSHIRKESSRAGNVRHGRRVT
jgi:cell division protein FtsW